MRKEKKLEHKYDAIESNQDNQAKSIEKNASSLTVHLLVMRHIKNPDVLIMDEDMQNITLGD